VGAVSRFVFPPTRTQAQTQKASCKVLCSVHRVWLDLGSVCLGLCLRAQWDGMTGRVGQNCPTDRGMFRFSARRAPAKARLWRLSVPVSWGKSRQIGNGRESRCKIKGDGEDQSDFPGNDPSTDLDCFLITGATVRGVGREDAKSAGSLLCNDNEEKECV
jgi:hypothetical protein